jgi:tRNA U34 2-thiouridine synthase MnmA/TrmU
VPVKAFNIEDQSIMTHRSEPKTVRALGLCSGGLDSILAGLVLRGQGILVEWITFETPFFSADKARRASEITGIALTVQNITETYIDMLRNPVCGYGQYMNPCMDCHALMFNLAGKRMREKGFDFLFSGEVLGQRPMSQTRPSLRYVEKHSGFDGYILRPLSARKLPETIPEKQGLVDRERLLDFSGRGRKRQIQLAAEFGITEYPAPAGGCLLTDKGYSNRLKDLFKHRHTVTENELHLLKYGRHLRISPETKAIVGRTRSDNENIVKYHDPRTDTVVRVRDHAGPIGLVSGKAARNAMMLVASVCVGYSKAPNLEPVKVELKTGGKKETVTVLGLSPKDIQHLIIP